jgi:hypothetical protein
VDEQEIVEVLAFWVSENAGCGPYKATLNDPQTAFDDLMKRLGKINHTICHEGDIDGG